MAVLKPGRSDRQTLSALLLSGKLNSSEEKAFRSMYNSLETGQIKLTPPQRMWADQIYDKLKLDTKEPSKFKKLPTQGAPPAVNPYDEMVKNRPLKPPGRS
jgi:hypothetical protein